MNEEQKYNLVSEIKERGGGNKNFFYFYALRKLK